MPSFNVGFVIFPELTQLDFTGPLQVLARLPQSAIHIVAKSERLPEHFIAIAKRQKAQDEVTEASKRIMVGGKLIFCVMQRVPGAGNNLTVQTSLAVCHAFPEFEQLYAQAAARPPRA